MHYLHLFTYLHLLKPYLHLLHNTYFFFYSCKLYIICYLHEYVIIKRLIKFPVKSKSTMILKQINP